MNASPDRWDRVGVVVAAGAALAAWEWLARHDVISSAIFPPPSVIAAAGWRLGESGALAAAVGATLRRVLLGLVIGGAPGWVLGLLMGWSPRLQRIADPIVAALHPVPKVALFPLLLVVFGLGELPRVFAIASGVFFPVLVSTLAGVRQIDRVYFEVARSCNVSAGGVFRQVVVPGSLPQALAGLRLGLNTALLLTIAVELLSARVGLGAMMWQARDVFRLEELYLGLAATAVLGVAFHLAVQTLTRRLVRWRDLE